ncbi:hypothetical protein [Erythrobacter sp. AP23]|uniref:preATP grasp domain-containing protein n=1 Tax=Erythrobacter sp. AP23 TaxID=499656 RepID=UPI00076D9912|nr:hypothetical protein [Erythrobacter sp. AP23]KWV94628.1 hypothetical protein ASS64_08580 [Erythrobacter sp. AP23]
MNAADISQNPPAGAAGLTFRSDYEPKIDSNEKARIADVAHHILLERPRLDRLPPFGPHCRQGLVDAPSLLIEDHSGIQLAHEHGADQHLSYRAALLAGDGDLLAVYGEREPAFEAYCRDVLGLGSFRVIAPPIADPIQSLARACIADGTLLEAAAASASRAGALNLVPYMTTGAIWLLAAEIGYRAGVPVFVAGPNPQLVRAVNDKLWFARWAARLLGKAAVPENRSVYGMAALVGHMRRFMMQHRAIGLKLSHSAASLGNMVLASEDYAGLSPSVVAGRLRDLMAQRGWRNPFPLQLTAWEGPLLGSPSVQSWIPHVADGPPIVEAVFDQATSGSAARFIGGMPSEFGYALQTKLAHEAACLATLFQSLGFFGRCSFDAVVIGEDETTAKLHWVECNGRWGGMSLPMTLANRLMGDWRGRGFLVFSHRDEGLIGLNLAEVLSRCDRLLFRTGQKEGLVILTPGQFAIGRLDCLVLASDQAAAREIAERTAHQLAE